MMKESDLFILADQALKGVVNQIKDNQWKMEMPLEFAMADKHRSYTLREVIDYHACDEAWVPDMLAGKSMKEVGVDTFDGDLLGDQPRKNFAALVEQACEAACDLEDPDRTVHFSYGDFPAREALIHITSFRGLRVYDLSKVLGLEKNMSDDLVRGLWDQLGPHAEEWRAMGVFGPEVNVSKDAPLQDRLLGLTGRNPG